MMPACSTAFNFHDHGNRISFLRNIQYLPDLCNSAGFENNIGEPVIMELRYQLHSFVSLRDTC